MTEKVSLQRNFNLALERAIDVLEEGKAIIYPTDTVYGLGCDATNEKAVESLYKIKERDKNKPVSVMVGNLPQLKEFFFVEDHLNTLLRYLPGPYTFIVKAKPPLSEVLGEKVGVRVPDNYFCRKMAVELEKPIVSTSANMSGKKPAASFDELDEVLDKVALAVDAGRLKYGSPSTVVDLVERKIVRQGDASFTF